MGLALKGRKSSSSSSRKSTRHDDTLFGQDTVELLLGLSEGPIYGLADGAASFFVGDVPLLDKGTQTPNISNFELRLLRGTNPADSIKLNLGGIASTKNVGLDLRTENQSIVVNCDKTQIDYLDLRFVVQQLFAVSAEGGEFPFDVQFKVEVKPRSAGVWQIPFNNEPPPTEETGSGGAAYRPGVTTPGMVVNAAYRETYTQPTQPAAGRQRGAMWFDTSTQYWTPKIWNDAAWVEPTNLVLRSAGAFPVWRWLDFDGAVRQAWYSGGGITPPANLLAANDFLLTPAIGEQIYSYNDTAWVGFQNWASPEPAAPGVLTISGLARQAYPKEYRIPVARINEPYDIRITRLSPVSTKTAFRNLNFESVQEVNRDAISFPDLAVAWLTIKATDTFTSIPEFTGIYRGLVIPVPSNYTFDETTKSGVYTGIWDGSFKMAYTNNPAWHAYNFIMNSRYGKNSYYPEVADKWDYYEFGRHCDAHKFRFNEYITEPRSLNELINYIVGVAGGRYVDRGDGFSTVIWDADDQPALALFTPENIIEGSVTYSFTDITERKNDFRVSFKNPELNYREDRLRVYDQNHIDVNGRNPEEFVAVGCRDAEEAVRRGRLRLATALTEKAIISFKTNRLGRYLLPFQVFLFSDPQNANLITGRTKNVEAAPVGTTVLPLRDQIYLEAGISYNVQFNASDGAGGTRIVTYPLTVASAGLQSELRLGRALSEELPEYAVFSIGSPKAYRITSIVPSDGNPDEIDITGIEVNRLKWAFVDGLVELRDILGLQTGPLSKFVYPPTDARIVPEITSDGKLTLLTSWQPSETKLTRGYRVYESINGEPMRVVYDGDQLIYRTNTPVAGTYVHSIVAVGLDGTTESAPITVQYVVANGTSLRSVSMPTNLRLVDEPEAPIFRAIDPRFTWDAAADPLVTKYRVEVLNGSNQVVHAETVSDLLLFTYTLAANRADNGGVPLRQFTVQVRAVDMIGNLSQPVALVVSHPAPIAPSFELSAVSEVVFVETTQPTGDWAGTLVFMEGTPGFNPVTTTPRADQRSTFFSLPAKVDHTYYVCVAAYDSYGKTGLNYSTEKVIKATIQLFDPSAPAIPGQPTLTSNVAETALDGTVTSRITIGWPAVTSSNLGRYEVFVAEGNNPADSAYVGERFVTGTSTVFAGLMPGRVYSFKLRSVSQNNFAASSMSPVLVVTAAANTIPPGAPTAFTVSSSFEAANLSWTNPSNKDLLGIEVWAGTTNAQANATLLKVVPYPAAFYRDVLGTSATKFYWIRAVNTSDYKSGFVGPQSATSPLLQAGQMAANIAESTAVAAGLATNKVVTSIPATKTHDYVTFQGKLYRWDATAGKYTAEVVATDISGKILAAQIDTINGDQIRGTVAAANIAGIEAGKITGQMTSDQIASLNAAKVSGQLTNATLSATKIFDKITSEQIQGITAAQLTTKITTTSIADGAISTPLLAAGAVQAANISAGAITAGKLTLSDPSNMVLNGSFNINGTPSSEGWSLGAGSVAEGGLPANDPGGPQRLRSTDRDQAFSNQIACTAGDVIYVSAMNANLSNYTANLYLIFYEADSSNPVYALVASRPAQSTAWQRMEGRATCPAGKQTFSVLLQTDRPSNPGDGSNCYWGKVQARRASSAELIVDGAIIARSIATDAIEASKIKAGAVTAGKLAVDAVTADNIAANAIVAGKIQSGAVETRHMTAGTINALVLVGQSITAGLLAANAVTAEKISANAVTAGKLLLTDMSNMLRNGDFGGSGAASSEGWSIGTNTQSFIDTASPDDPGGYHRLRSDFRDQAISHVIACTVDDQFYLSAMVNQQHSSAAQILVRFADAQALEKSFPAAASTTVKDSWVRLEGRVTAPPGATQFQVFLQNERSGGEAGLCYWGRVQCRRAASAQMIVDGAITTDKLTANAVTAGKIASNQITTAHIQAGAIKADQIDAGAISADKLGIGLNTGNLIWNSDQALDGWYQHNDSYNTLGFNGEWAVTGTNAIVTFSAGAPRSGAADFLTLLAPTSSNGKTANFPVQAGKTYEYSVYLSAHRCSAFANMYWVRADGSYIGELSSQNITNVQAKGAPNDTWRAKVRGTAPGDATAVVLRFVMHQQNANDAYVFASGFYLGICDPKATAWSEYAPQSRTIITGGQIATDSIHANRIQARTITGDRIVAGTIGTEQINADQLKARIIDTDGLQAAKIVVGGTRLNNWVSSANNTQINGGAIATNSIEASRIRVGARGLNLVDVSFYSERDGNENLTNVFCWTGGYVLWTDDNGTSQATRINNGNLTRVGYDGGYWYVIWVKGSGQFLFEKDTWGNHVNQQDRVLIATVSGITGISVLVGSTIIDGTRITTGSIQADRIAANQIQTRHMSANSISGDRIQVGTMSADRITTGTITAGKTIFLGDDRFMLDADTQMIRIRNRTNSTEQLSLGAVGKFYGNNNDFGLILRDWNNVEVLRIAGGYAEIHGAYIKAATIGSASIGDLQVTTAKIGDLQVGNSKIADFAVSTITAASGGGRDISTNTVSRSGNSKFLILAFFNGNSNLGSTAGPGAFSISRNGTQLTSVSASFALFKPDSGNLQYYLNSMCIGVIDQPGAGAVSYSCFHSNGQGVGGVTVVAMELAK